MVGGVNGSNPNVKMAPATGGKDIAQLEQQKKSLQQQIKRIKGNDSLAPEVKQSQLEMLQKKLEKIESEIQRQLALEKQNTAKQPSKAEEVAETATAEKTGEDSLNKELDDDQKNGIRKAKVGEVGSIVDQYV